MGRLTLLRAISRRGRGFLVASVLFNRLCIAYSWLILPILSTRACIITISVSLYIKVIELDNIYSWWNNNLLYYLAKAFDMFSIWHCTYICALPLKASSCIDRCVHKQSGAVLLKTASCLSFFFMHKHDESHLIQGGLFRSLFPDAFVDPFSGRAIFKHVFVCRSWEIVSCKIWLSFVGLKSVDPENIISYGCKQNVQICLIKY